MAVDSNLRTVVGAEDGPIESILGNEGSMVQAWVNVRGGLRACLLGVLLALRGMDP